MPCHWRTISRTCLRWCRQKGSILWLCGFLSPYTVGRCFRKKKAMKFISAFPSVAQTLEPPATFYSCKKYYFAPCLQSRQSWSFADWKKGRCSVYILHVYMYICIIKQSKRRVLFAGCTCRVSENKISKHHISEELCGMASRGCVRRAAALVVSPTPGR